MDTLQRQTLAWLVDHYAGGADGVHPTAIPGVHCLRLSAPHARLPNVLTPSICVIAQGRKRVYLEDEEYDYRPSQFLAVSVDLAVISEVIEGSEARPYLCLQIELDPIQLTDVLLQVPTATHAGDETTRGIFVGEADTRLGDCVLRLAKLLDTPEEIAPLAPMIKREIHYRLLTGPHGAAIAQLGRAGSNMQRIVSAIRTLKSDFDKPVTIEALASRVGMSVSSFHSHFKAVTALSPLQYQKRLRLMEARNIMLAEQCDVESTAYRVGYESASQFSREYARLFGNPPKRDIQRLATGAKPPIEVRSQGMV